MKKGAKIVFKLEHIVAGKAILKPLKFVQFGVSERGRLGENGAKQHLKTQ